MPRPKAPKPEASLAAAPERASTRTDACECCGVDTILPVLDHASSWTCQHCARRQDLAASSKKK